MVWKATGPMEQRLQFAARVLRGEESMSELCRQFGISRKTGYKWARRVRELGARGLEDRSHVPSRCPHALDPALGEQILALRAAHPTWGPRKLRGWLDRQRPHTAWPAPSTIGTLLHRHGLAAARPRRRSATPNAGPLSAVDGANHTWCADFKGWVQVGQRRLTPLTITDAHSRFIIRCQALNGCTGYEQVRPLFDAAFRQYGLPWVMRTDNGPPFASVGLGGLSRLAVWWIKLGITPQRIAPGHPEQNGRHERMHRVLKAETMNPPASTARSQHMRFARFVREYNYDRPHEALGQTPPAALYEPSPRPYPRALLDPAEHYAHGWMVRKIKDSGRMKWDGHEIHVCNALEGEYIGLKPTHDGWWDVYFAHLLVARFDERNLRIIANRAGGSSPPPDTPHHLDPQDKQPG